MDRRFLTVLGVSLVFALVVSSVFYQMTSRAGAGARKQEVTDYRDIVVTTRPLSVGGVVKPADVKIIKVPAEAFPKGAYSKVEEVLDRPIISNILLEEPILDGRLAAKGAGLGLAPTIPVGMRAVTVRVNDVAAVAGFVLAGLHVDVLVTGRPPGGDGDITSTVLQDMLVLSNGTTLQPDARGQAAMAPTVTLLATPEQAETLTLANIDGRIQLVLRNSSDAAVENTPGRHVDELFNGSRKPAPPPAAPSAAPKPKPKPVEVVQAPPPKPPAPVAVPPPVPAPPDQVVVIRGAVRSVETLPSHSNDAPGTKEK
ncbi:MAG TPA: Flp pilus assembly protein CpaB [Bryobacteraceae bacterium]|jgi:pilus assembly protein CpaB